MIRLLSTIAIVLAAGAWGCGSAAYRSLESDRELERLAPLVAEYEATSPRTVLVETRGPEDVALDVAVHEIGDGRAERVIVFVHGVLSDHTTWKYVVGPLREEGDLLLIDLPGSGESEIRVPAKMGGHPEGAYDTESIAYRVLEAVGARLEARERPAREVAFVAHSHGTLITTRLLTDESIAPADRGELGLVDRVVLIAPVDVALPFGPPTLESLATTPGFVFAFGAATGILKDRVAKGTIANTGGVQNTPRESVDRTLKILGDPRRRKVTQAVVRNAVPRMELNGRLVPDWERLESVESMLEELDERDGPRVLLVSGTRDETVPHSMAWKLAAKIPQSELLVLPGIGHSPMMQAPHVLARAIGYFVERGTVRGLEGAVSGEPKNVRIYRAKGLRGE